MLAGVVLVVVSALVGYLAGNAVRSPAQVVADTAAPARTTLTEPVALTKVTQSVAFDAQVEPRYASEVTAPAGDESSGSGVVTRLRARVGHQVQPGQVVAEVSGRPVFVLQGKLPSYRTVAPGMVGPDVKQLHQAIAQAGFASINALYGARGYQSTRVGDDEVKAAEEAVRSAERSFTEAKTNDASKLERKFAAEDLARAQTDLAAARSKSGAQVMLGEVVFVPALPATVTSVNASVGSSVTGSLMTLSSGPLVVRGAPVSADASRMRKGASARLLLSPGGNAKGKVTAINVAPAEESGDVPAGTADPTATTMTYTLTPTEPLPKKSAGTPVRVVVAVASSPSAGLTVPISAVSSSAAGDTTVTVIRGKTRHTVAITPGFSGDGYVQVVAKEQDALAEGDQVVTGANSGGG